MTRAELEYVWAELCKEFMQPQVRWIKSHECSDCGVPFQGWYHRLSAPGYLDCTDWSGPFSYRTDAEEDLVSTYGDHVVWPPVAPAEPTVEARQSALPATE